MNDQIEKALHAAQQNMTDIIDLWRNGRTSDLVFGEAIRDMKNDGLKLVKQARAALAATPAAGAAEGAGEAPHGSLLRVLEKWAGVEPGELDNAAVPLFEDEMALAGLKVVPILHPTQAADEARDNFVQLTYAAKSRFPGLPEGYTHEDIDRLYQWAYDADDTLRLAPAMLRAAVPATPAAPAAVEAVGAAWVPVGERLPDNTFFQSSAIVLVHLWNGTQLAAFYDYAAGFWREHTEGGALTVTHWQPLPAAPASVAAADAADTAPTSTPAQ